MDAARIFLREGGAEIAPKISFGTHSVSHKSWYRTAHLTNEVMSAKRFCLHFANVIKKRRFEFAKNIWRRNQTPLDFDIILLRRNAGESVFKHTIVTYAKLVPFLLFPSPLCPSLLYFVPTTVHLYVLFARFAAALWLLYYVVQSQTQTQTHWHAPSSLTQQPHPSSQV